MRDATVQHRRLHAAGWTLTRQEASAPEGVVVTVESLTAALVKVGARRGPATVADERESMVRGVLEDREWARKQDFRWWWSIAGFLLERLDAEREAAAAAEARVSVLVGALANLTHHAAEHMLDHEDATMLYDDLADFAEVIEQARAVLPPTVASPPAPATEDER